MDGIDKYNYEGCSNPHTSTNAECETDDTITWRRDGAVKIRYGPTIESIPSMTVSAMLCSSAQQYPHHKALAFKVDNKWECLTYAQYLEQVKACAKSLIKLGLEPFKGVGIIGFNCKEWFFVHLGAILAGGLATGIYATNCAEACAYVASSAEAQVIAVENEAQLQKILEVWSELPSLKAVVQWTGKPSTHRADVFSWDAFIALGQEVPESVLAQRILNQHPNQCCCLIYTSGTTGKPKGVMLSHDNITYSTRTLQRFIQPELAKETIISYLPLSHIAAQMLDIYLAIAIGTTVYFAQPDALKGTLNTTMKEVCPTIFFGVPRVFEKMQEKIQRELNQTGGLRKAIINWGRRLATKTAQNLQRGEGPASGHAIANFLFYKKLRKKLGLTSCKFFYCGAAPVSMDTHNFFASLNLPICEVFGMSESCGAATMSALLPHNKHWKPGSAGTQVKGLNFELFNKDETGNGEIVIYGRHVFMGYIGEEEKTKATFDAKCGLRSGDIGSTDKDGMLFITGRIKELLKTAGGENVAPVPIENIVKEELPVVANCILIGDRMKFLTLLLSLKTEMNPDVMRPTDQFTAEVKSWCQSLGSSASNVLDVINRKDPLVTKALQEGIDRANKRSESRAKTIRKFAILPVDFSVVGGELGPTLKLKRGVVTEMYKELIDSLYVSDD